MNAMTPISDSGMVTIGMSVDAQIAEEQEDHDDDDDRRLASGSWRLLRSRRG